MAAQAGGGTIFTLWPLIDYRTSPGEDFSNLSILGPLFKFEKRGDERETAVRPIFYRTDHVKDSATSTYFLYPAAYFDTTKQADAYELFQLFKVTDYRKDEPEERERGTMLFPFYMTGTSHSGVPYRSVFPFYGDIYDHFWRDEYHYVMFPLYGSTVKRGTTTRHYLWPIFSTTEGENESGFEAFPLYGHTEKKGVYDKRFVLWPFYTTWKTKLDTDNPTENTFFFPFYDKTESPKKSSRTYLWPFFGYTENREKKFTETDYFWPFITKIRGEERNADSFLPIYSRDTFKDGERRWYMWPLYRHEEIRSKELNRDSDRVLFFLFRRSHESWPADGRDRTRTAMWPLFLYQNNTRGVSSFSFPAPVESILDKEGIEKNWAPFWRLYQRRWDEDGNSASSLLWNLYWHERRGDDLAYELFPLISYRGVQKESELKLFKGLFSLKTNGEEREVSLLWLPFGVKWGAK